MSFGEGDEKETLDEAEAPPASAKALGAWRSSSKRISSKPLASLRKEEDKHTVGGYEILGQIGRGGCGTVYKALDPQHDRQVALKVLMRRDGHGRKRFEREIAAVSQLQHPGIVPLFDSGEADGCLFMVMELIGGHSLAELASLHHDCNQGDPPSIETTVTIVRDAAKAIHYAHGEGILHRDIKPHNMLVDANGHTHVTDFGLALLTEEDMEQITKSGAALGTPAYMPPEQASGKREQLDARSDVYSLGASLFHALTGETPFERQSAEGLVFAIFRGEPPPPSEIKPDLPPEIDAIVLRCVQKEPSDRYPTAKALADDLDRFLNGEPVQAFEQKLGPVGRAIQAMRRRPVVTGLSVALGVTLVAFVVLLVRYEQLVLRGP